MHILNVPTLLAKAEVRQAIEQVRAAVNRVLPEGGFADRETAVLAITNEAARELLEGGLRATARSFPDEITINDISYRRHEEGTVTYHSLCGPLSVPRDTFREMGIRNGPTVVPLDWAAGIVEGATPALAYDILLGYGRHDMRAHEEQLRSAHRVPPSRSTLERIATAIGGAAVRETPRIEPLVRRREDVPEDAVSIAIGLDRTSVPMIEERPADAPAKPEPKRRRPLVRTPPEPFDVNYRMAYVGTVTFCAANGEALEIRRYALPACDDPRQIVERMTDDVRQALKLRPTLAVGIVQDGAHEMWNRTREGMEKLLAEGRLTEWRECIDRYHLLERLGGALAIVEPDPDERARVLGAWKTGLDDSDRTIDEVENFIAERYLAMEETLSDEHREKLEDHVNFLQNNSDRMRYKGLRDAGLPVGSGVTESSAKNTVGHRAKGSGQRWLEANLRGVLTLRAHHQSDRLPKFWSHFQRGYAANVQALADAA